jgi:ATP-binding cassette subfamily B (MDR/TAP) protein 1
MRHITAGDIFIDGHSIKKIDLKSLRRNIASVSQEPSLFSGTIKDNLRIGKMDATDEEITEAATTANIHSFISKLPNGYLTEVCICSIAMKRRKGNFIFCISDSKLSSFQN